MSNRKLLDGDEGNLEEYGERRDTDRGKEEKKVQPYGSDIIDH